MKYLLALFSLVFLFGCTSAPHLGEIINYTGASPIVFMSKAEEKSGELYLLNDSNITRLTHNTRHENNPAFSPDRKKIAYHGGNESNPLTWEVYVLDLKTGVETQITHNNIIDGHPDWSPDGTKIVYASFEKNGRPAGVAELKVFDILTNKTYQLTHNTWEDNDPEWSPDGTKIIFKSNRDTKVPAREEIYVMNSDGTDVKRLTKTTDWNSDHDASWAPDSNSVVFERYEGKKVPWNYIANLTYLAAHTKDLLPWNIYSVDLLGNLTQLTNVRQIAFLPVYSSDGTSLMYMTIDFIYQNGQVVGAEHKLIETNADGKNPHEISLGKKHLYELQYFDW